MKDGQPYGPGSISNGVVTQWATYVDGNQDGFFFGWDAADAGQHQYEMRSASSQYVNTAKSGFSTFASIDSRGKLKPSLNTIYADNQILSQEDIQNDTTAAYWKPV